MKSSSSLVSVVFLILLVSAACADMGWRDAPAEPVMRDSAGVAIVENRAPAWGDEERWRISADPLVTIGSLEGPAEQQLYGVRNVVRLSDGRIAVANSSSREIRIYSPAGEHVRDVGGRGDGPGEFQSLDMVGRYAGDSIAAWDARLRRLSVFDSAGKFGRVWTVEGVTGMIVPALGLFDDGTLALTPGMSPQDLLASGAGRTAPGHALPAGERGRRH